MKNKIEILKEQAINEAIAGNFNKAIALNETLLKENHLDIETYLRLGFAYFQINDLPNSKKSYHKALKMQPANQIARNNLERIKILERKGNSTKSKTINDYVIDPNLFLNIVGKTKVVPLTNTGLVNVVAKLQIGKQVYLKIKKRRVEVRNDQNEYVGVFPDDISRRLIVFIEAGSEYCAFIKEASRNVVEIFIKEEKKGKKVLKFTSFPKDLQEDMKVMMGSGEELEDKEADEDEEKGDQPIDLETLASEIDDKDHFEPHHNFEEESDDLEE